MAFLGIYLEPWSLSITVQMQFSGCCDPIEWTLCIKSHMLIGHVLEKTCRGHWCRWRMMECPKQNHWWNTSDMGALSLPLDYIKLPFVFQEPSHWSRKWTLDIICIDSQQESVEQRSGCHGNIREESVQQVKVVGDSRKYGVKEETSSS